MERSKLEAIGKKLDVSRDNVRSIRWERWRQRWIFPIIGAIFAVGATIIGYLDGRDDTYYIDGAPQGYPWSMTVARITQPVVSFIPFAFMIPIMGMVKLRERPDNNRMIIHMGILIVLVILGLLGYVLAYEYARPEVRGEMTMGSGIKYSVWHQ